MRPFVFLCLLIASDYCSAQDPLYYTDGPLPCVQKKFQVYVYIVNASFGGPPVLSAPDLKKHISTLNQAFEPICISFEVCNTTYIEDYSYGKINDDTEIDLLTSRYNKKRRINLYFTNEVQGESLNSYSVFNAIQDTEGATLIVPASGLGLVHEMGHTFGLYHIFEEVNGLETVDGKNCRTAGDLLCDTPAAPEKFVVRKDCQFESLEKDPNGSYYKAEVGNYMSHHFCAHCFFTREQYMRMADNYLNSSFYMW